MTENVALPAGSPFPSSSGIDPASVVPFQVTVGVASKSRKRSGWPVGAVAAQKSTKPSGPNCSDALAEKNTNPVPDVAVIPSQLIATTWSVNFVAFPADAVPGIPTSRTNPARIASDRLMRVPPMAARQRVARLPLTARRARLGSARSAS